MRNAGPTASGPTGSWRPMIDSRLAERALAARRWAPRKALLVRLASVVGLVAAALALLLVMALAGPGSMDDPDASTLATAVALLVALLVGGLVGWLLSTRLRAASCPRCGLDWDLPGGSGISPATNVTMWKRCRGCRLPLDVDYLREVVAGTATAEWAPYEALVASDDPEVDLPRSALGLNAPKGLQVVGLLLLAYLLAAVLTGLGGAVSERLGGPDPGLWGLLLVTGAIFALLMRRRRRLPRGTAPLRPDDGAARMFVTGSLALGVGLLLAAVGLATTPPAPVLVGGGILFGLLGGRTIANGRAVRRRAEAGGPGTPGGRGLAG